jgi:general secretion pathway protein H
VRPRTLQAGCTEGGCAEDGFTLLEVVCVVAILAILAATIMPAFSRGTSKSRLESYAVAIAALLKADRNAAVRRQTQIATEVDAPGRTIRSRTTGRTVHLPNDVDMDAILTARCLRTPSGPTIRFLSSGMSCGGVIALRRAGSGFEIRVNWLTGGVEIVPINRA